MIERKFFIAGVQHHEMHKVINDLSEGDELELVPEPSNKFDPNAVRIEYEGTMLGYVPKKFSAEISALLEVGESIACVIENLNPDGKPWEWCEVTISDFVEEKETEISEEEDEEFIDEDYNDYEDDELE